MSCFDADAVEVRESEWIKIGVDTGAGKTAWPQGVTNGKRIPGNVDVPLSSLASDCMLKVATMSQSQSWRCRSACVQTTVVCWRKHDDGSSCNHVW